MTVHFLSPVIRDGGWKVLKLGVHIVHVVHSVPHAVVVEGWASVRLIVPPAATIAIVAPPASSVIETIPPAIVLTTVVMLLVTPIPSPSLLTLLSLSPQGWGRGGGLCWLVNPGLPQLLLQVRLLPRDPLPGLPLRVEVTLIDLDLDTTLYISPRIIAALTWACSRGRDSSSRAAWCSLSLVVACPLLSLSSSSSAAISLTVIESTLS